MIAKLLPPTDPVHLPRAQAAEKINLAMARFPMILKILRELNDSEVLAPGDSDIRHGCQRALTAILVEIARLDYAAPGKPSAAELKAQHWIHSSEALELVDGDILQRMEQFIDYVLNSHKA